jgi:hypothetical protein
MKIGKAVPLAGTDRLCSGTKSRNIRGQIESHTYYSNLYLKSFAELSHNAWKALPWKRRRRMGELR